MSYAEALPGECSLSVQASPCHEARPDLGAEPGPWSDVDGLAGGAPRYRAPGASAGPLRPTPRRSAAEASGRSFYVEDDDILLFNPVPRDTLAR